MIRMTKTADYGIVLMSHLAGFGDGEPHNAREIARAAGLPQPVVSKLLKALAREGLLESHRGAKGGYSLAHPPEDITAAQIITALEGPIGLTECTVHPGQCVQEASCHVREPWQRINAAVRDALGGITLGDLAQTVEPEQTISIRGLDAAAGDA